LIYGANQLFFSSSAEAPKTPISIDANLASSNEEEEEGEDEGKFHIL